MKIQFIQLRKCVILIAEMKVGNEIKEMVTIRETKEETLEDLFTEIEIQKEEKENNCILSPYTEAL